MPEKLPVYTGVRQNAVRPQTCLWQDCFADLLFLSCLVLASFKRRFALHTFD